MGVAVLVTGVDVDELPLEEGVTGVVAVIFFSTVTVDVAGVGTGFLFCSVIFSPIVKLSKVRDVEGFLEPFASSSANSNFMLSKLFV